MPCAVPNSPLTTNHASLRAAVIEPEHWTFEAFALRAASPHFVCEAFLPVALEGRPLPVRVGQEMRVRIYHSSNPAYHYGLEPYQPWQRIYDEPGRVTFAELTRDQREHRVRIAGPCRPCGTSLRWWNEAYRLIVEL